MKRFMLHIKRRRFFLLFLFVLDVVYAYSLFTPGLAAMAPTYIFLSHIMPLSMWASLWGFVGISCLIFAFRKDQTLGFAFAMMIKVLWAFIFLLGWMFADVDRGYLSTVIWGGFAIVVGLIATWPEPTLPEVQK